MAQTLFTVRGGGRFPLSMLRFDEAWPYTDEDAAKIEKSFDGYGRWEVQLLSDKMTAPTLGRWDSFATEVVCRAEDY